MIRDNLHRVFDYQIEKTKEGDIKWTFHRPYRSTWIIASDDDLNSTAFDAFESIAEKAGLEPAAAMEILAFLRDTAFDSARSIIYGKNCYHHWGKKDE